MIEEIDISLEGDSIVISGDEGPAKGELNEDNDTINFDDGDEWQRAKSEDEWKKWQ